ncbi:Quinone oxidoreductase 1 [Streptomyces sp. YIM 121038]|uniref:zinc-binding dehydrogenase n=1 Tax=Streptomyces sp. YIM 121038 TaxID=2136401 RepID=UPI001110BEDA|nr:zinc-binding dehydrogenase [Streptomyces sp. YIM 121038]QCX75535.1 Quinone oxidoreductase 1 [Streptomyces sp. YIM 121038]
MHAIRLHAFGGPEELRYEEVGDPEPGPGQVRIAVRAAGVHLLDTALQRGADDALPFPLPDLPVTPGREVAGVVDRLGDGVAKEWLGRRVVTHLGLVNAGYAELAVRETEALFPLPDSVSYEAAIAMVGTGRMALGVLEVAAPAADDVVLVTAAAGGIGTLLVQAARNLGATVVGAAGGPDKAARVRALGADVAVDYDRPDWADEVRAALGGREVDVVFDSVGGAAGRAAFDLLGYGGQFVMYGWSAGTPTEFTSEDLHARLLTATYALGPRILRVPGGLRALQERALAEAASGTLVPAVTTFPLRDAAAAHTALLGRATVGKVVLLAAAEDTSGGSTGSTHDNTKETVAS